MIIATSKIADNLGDLHNVTGRDLLLVCLETTRPVRRFLNIGCAKNRENGFKPVFVHNVTNPNKINVFGGNLNSKISLAHAKSQVDLLFSANHAGGDFLNLGGTVVRVNNGLTDLK